MVDLKGGEPIATPKKSKHGLTMTAVKNWLMPDKNKGGQQHQHPDKQQAPVGVTAQDSTPFRQRMPESFLRSIRRRSLRVKRTKSLVLPEKRKSDSFVNSQEWTLSRAVPDLRLGIVGSLSSGKSALVHRYLTGSYMQEESPEGGRFKKEILVDGQSHLLLIRDEGGPPELQFTAWVDAVIFVFSLENESSFNAVYNYYTKMSHFRNPAEIPLILVGTQDAISENNPRVIDDTRARKLATELKRCTYYETCATYGLNVERVFQDACQRIVQQRLSHTNPCLTPTNSRPSTPNNHHHISTHQPQFHGTAGTLPSAPPVAGVHPPSRHHLGGGGGGTSTGSNNSAASTTTSNSSNGVGNVGGYHTTGPLLIGLSPSNGSALGHYHQHMSPSHNNHTMSHKDAINMSQLSGRQVHTLSSSSHQLHRQDKEYRSLLEMQQHLHQQQLIQQQHMMVPTENNNVTATKFAAPHPLDNLKQDNMLQPQKDLPTPSSTPTTSRKSRRRSNLFTPSKKGDDKLKNGGDIGSGRAIPIKQGYLHKRSSKPLNREWKKKYVTLCDDGRLTYHSSLHDYMEDSHGKEISLQYVTVKIPGRNPKGTKSIITVAGTGGGNNSSSTNSSLNDGIGGLTINSKEKHRLADKVLLTAYDVVKEPGVSNGVGKYSQPVSGDEGMVLSNSNSFLNGDTVKGATDTVNIKKRHRRMKSSGVKNPDCDDPDEYEFYIVSLDNKQWHFEATSSEERDEWVAAIEQQILNSLQLNESCKNKKQNNPMEAASIESIRSRVPGNGFCVDCDDPKPKWASLNLGVLMCIECSGIHRNLGSHISKVRSLDLDEWPPGHLAVMLAIGNSLANSVWEARIPTHLTKPTAASSRDDKQLWIRHKYELKEFLAPMSVVASGTTTNGGALMSLEQQLIDAVCASNMKNIVSVLAQTTPEQVNTTVGPRDLRTPLHLACAMGQLAIAQLLIWHNANVNATDQDGRTCLFNARTAATFASSKFELDRQNLAAELAVAASHSLVELLLACGCIDTSASVAMSTTLPGSGTLPRRRAGNNGTAPAYEKITSSVI